MLFTLLFYPIRVPEFFIYRRAKISPPVARGIHFVFQPTFGFTCPQKIKTAKQNHKGQESKRKSGGNVVNPDAENER